jgi:hypothetical protein
LWLLVLRRGQLVRNAYKRFHGKNSVWTQKGFIYS